MKQQKIYSVDFTPKDIDDAIGQILRLRRDGQLVGLLFAAKIRSSERLVFGSAGCCAADGLATVGAAKQLLEAVVARSMNQ